MKTYEYYNSLFEKAKEKRSSFDTQMRILDAFVNGDQWKLTNASETELKPVSNYMWKVANTKAGLLLVNELIGRLEPESADDLGRINELQSIYEDEWTKARCYNAISEATYRSQVVGSGYVHIGYDENIITGGTNTMKKGEIVVGAIDPANVYIDPSTFVFDDANYIIIKMRKTREWIKAQTQYKNDTINGNENDVQDPVTRGEIYDRDYTNNQEGLVDFFIIYEKVPSTTHGNIFQATYMANGKILHHIPDMIPRCFPIAQVNASKEAHSVNGKPSTAIVLDNQKMISKIESIIGKMALQQQNPVKVVNKASGIDIDDVANYGDAYGAVFESNISADQAITYIKPPEIPSVLMAMKDTVIANIKDVLNLTEASIGGNVGTAGNTSGGVNALIAQSKLPDKMMFNCFEEFIENFTRKFIMYVTTKYSEIRYTKERLIQDGGNTQYKFTPYIGTDYKDLNYDFKFSVTEKLEQTPAKRKQDALEMFQLQNQYANSGLQVTLITPEELIQAIKPENEKAILERIKKDKEAKSVETAEALYSTLQHTLDETGALPDIGIIAEFLQQIK